MQKFARQPYGLFKLNYCKIIHLDYSHQSFIPKICVSGSSWVIFCQFLVWHGNFYCPKMPQLQLIWDVRSFQTQFPKTRQTGLQPPMSVSRFCIFVEDFDMSQIGNRNGINMPKIVLRNKFPPFSNSIFGRATRSITSIMVSVCNLVFWNSRLKLPIITIFFLAILIGRQNQNSPLVSFQRFETQGPSQWVHTLGKLVKQTPSFFCFQR